MGIVTKGGDTGETARFGGSRVRKDDLGVIANGEVDELNSIVGILIACGLPQGITDDLRAIQGHCFTIGSELATPADAKQEALAYIPRICHEDIAFLERRIEDMERQVPVQRRFILPGGSREAAAVFWARTVARRAERSVVAFSQEAPLSGLVIQYLNRVSDFFYIVARFLNARAGVSETEWKGGGGQAQTPAA